MNILLVSSSVLPQTGGSSVIVENLAQNFLRNELTVLESGTWKLKMFQAVILLDQCLFTFLVKSTLWVEAIGTSDGLETLGINV